MANNRMYLIDNDTQEKVLLAKYYPSTGWYLKSDAVEKLNMFFDTSLEKSTDLEKDTDHFSTKGNTNFTLEFESK